MTDAPTESGDAPSGDERSRRLAKVQALRELGREPYPVRLDRTHTDRKSVV